MASAAVPIDDVLALSQLREALSDLDEANLIFKSDTFHPDEMPPVGKLYEAWMMFRLANDLVISSAFNPSIAWHLSDGTPAQFNDDIIFRGSPAYLVRTGSQDEPGYLSIDDLGDPVLEIHSSLRFRGWSNADHELDLVVMRSEVVQAWWEDPNEPDWVGMNYIAAFELKCHARSIELGLVRQAALTRLDLAARFREVSLPGTSPPVIAQFPFTFGWVGARSNAMHVFVAAQPMTSSGFLISNTYGLVPISMAPGVPTPADDLARWNGIVEWICDRL